MKTKFGLLLLSALGIAALLFWQQEVKPLVGMRLLMDTLVTIRVYGAANVASSAMDAGFAQFAEVEQAVSFYLPESQTGQLNRNGSINAGSHLIRLCVLSNDLYQQTNGCFDPTFAALQQVWGFYSDTKALTIPTDFELRQALSRTGWSKRVSFDEKSGEISLASGSIVDFGGIAGGHAIELAAGKIRQSGCRAFLIDDAGDIWFEGEKPDKSPWKIAVRDPRDNSALAVVESFRPVAISTSGDYERFLQGPDGRRYGHIMNPHTGYPVNFYRSVTVVASTPVEADVFSTAAFAMPEEQMLRWSEARNLPVLCLTADNRILVNSSGRAWFKMVKQ